MDFVRWTRAVMRLQRLFRWWRKRHPTRGPHQDVLALEPVHLKKRAPEEKGVWEPVTECEGFEDDDWLQVDWPAAGLAGRDVTPLSRVQVMTMDGLKHVVIGVRYWPSTSYAAQGFKREPAGVSFICVAAEGVYEMAGESGKWVYDWPCVDAVDCELVSWDQTRRGYTLDGEGVARLRTRPKLWQDVQLYWHKALTIDGVVFYGATITPVAIGTIARGGIKHLSSGRAFSNVGPTDNQRITHVYTKDRVVWRKTWLSTPKARWLGPAPPIKGNLSTPDAKVPEVTIPTPPGVAPLPPKEGERKPPSSEADGETTRLLRELLTLTKQQRPAGWRHADARALADDAQTAEGKPCDGSVKAFGEDIAVSGWIDINSPLPRPRVMLGARIHREGSQLRGQFTLADTLGPFDTFVCAIDGDAPDPLLAVRALFNTNAKGHRLNFLGPVAPFQRC